MEKLWKMCESIEILNLSRHKEEPNCHATNFFTEHLLAIEMKKKKTEILLNKPVYLGLSILESSKI